MSPCLISSSFQLGDVVGIIGKEVMRGGRFFKKCTLVAGNPCASCYNWRDDRLWGRELKSVSCSKFQCNILDHPMMISSLWRSGETSSRTLWLLSVPGKQMSTSVVKSTDRDPPFAAVSEKFAGLTLIRFRFFPLAKASNTISTVEPE